MNVPFLDLRAAYRELQAEIDAAVRRVVSSGWYVLGPEVEGFENEFAAYCGARHCIGISNGLDALELALRGYGIGAGDEVIVPTNTFIATWLAVSQDRCGPGAGRAGGGRLTPSRRTGSSGRSPPAPGPSCRCISTASRPTCSPLLIWPVGTA